MNTTFNPKKIRMVSALGNPGEEYENTYHNIGRVFLERIVKSRNIEKFSSYDKFKYAKKGKIVFVEPKTFMNDSGAGLKKALAYFKIKKAELVVIHDDADLAIGSFKLSYGRGSAGHKGVESVIKNLKTKNFWRLRIGIRPDYKSKKRKKAMQFVLSKIGKKESKLFEKVFSECLDLFNK